MFEEIVGSWHPLPIILSFLAPFRGSGRSCFCKTVCCVFFVGLLSKGVYEQHINKEKGDM